MNLNLSGLTTYTTPRDITLLVHDGFGIWCAARRLNAGRFVWPVAASVAPSLALTSAQFDALVLGLPWQRLPELSVITRA